MFEKEAFEEKAKEWADKLYPCDGQAQRYLLMGAKFGYNKANEWHYPSKGEYPEDFIDILICFTENDMKDCVRGWCEYYPKGDKHIFKYVNVLGTQYPKTVIAWKEIVFPELKEVTE